MLKSLPLGARLLQFIGSENRMRIVLGAQPIVSATAIVAGRGDCTSKGVSRPVAIGVLHFVAPGSWSDHELWFAWNSSNETLHLCLSLDAKTPPEARARVFELVSLLNERMWLGHFDVWSEDQTIVYRCALPLPDASAPSRSQIACMVAAALDAGERFYPAYNFLVWAGKSPSDAVTAAMFETAGEA